MKKTLLAILGLVASISLFAACDSLTETSTDSTSTSSSSSAHEHSWASTWSKDDTHHWHACTGEDCEEKNDNAAHSGGTATCEDKAVCTVCGQAYGALAAHVYDQEVVENTYLKSEATCKDAAVYYKSCECGAFDNGETAATFVSGTPTSVHTPEADDNNCTTAIECSVCGVETTAANSHAYDNACDTSCNNAGCTAGNRTTSHTPEADDNNCTTATNCSICGAETTAANSHAYDNDCDADCNNVGCTAGNRTASHKPELDDGDCTTAIECSVCGAETTAAKEHTPSADGVTCENCTTVLATVVNAGVYDLSANVAFETAITGTATKVMHGETDVTSYCTIADGSISVPYAAMSTIPVGEQKFVVTTADQAYLVNITVVTKYIKTVADFQAIENDMAGYYVLANNLSIYGGGGNESNNRWNTPLGAKQSNTNPGTNVAFTGTLDGNGYTLTYVYSWGGFGSNNHDKSLFYIIGATGVVKNLGLNVTEGVGGGTARTAALAWINNGTIENVYTKISFSHNASGQNEQWAAAGLVVSNYGTIDNCIVEFTDTTTSGTAAAAVVAMNNAGATISNTVAIVTSGNSGTVYQNVQNGTRDANSTLYGTYASFYAAKDSFIENGFELGEFWKITDSAVSFTAKTHVYDQEVVLNKYLQSAANCGSGAVYYKSCACCGGFETGDEAASFVVGEAVGEHAYTDDGDCTTAIECSVCGDVVIEGKAHTPTADGMGCENCDAVLMNVVDGGVYDLSANVAFEVAITGTATKVMHGETDVTSYCTIADGSISVPYAAMSTIPVGEQKFVVTTAEKTYIVSVTIITKHIKTVADFQAIENDMAGYYVLANNLSIYGGGGNESNNRWNTPLGAKQSNTNPGTNVPFTGTLDGNGYTLTYVYSWGGFGSNNHDKSLFYIIGETGVVKNLGLNVTDGTGGAMARSAALAWINNGTIENVYTKIKFTHNASGQNLTYGSAGLVANNYGAINNCIVDFTDTTTSGVAVAAVVGMNNAGATITNTVAIVTSSNSGTAYQYTNNGTKTNTPIYTSYADFYAAKDSFISGGFVEGAFWTIGESAITFAPKAA